MTSLGNRTTKFTNSSIIRNSNTEFTPRRKVSTISECANGFTTEGFSAPNALDLWLSMLQPARIDFPEFVHLHHRKVMRHHLRMRRHRRRAPPTQQAEHILLVAIHRFGCPNRCRRTWRRRSGLRQRALPATWRIKLVQSRCLQYGASPRSRTLQNRSRSLSFALEGRIYQGRTGGPSRCCAVEWFDC